MSDEVFWDSSLSFLFKQFDLLKEMNEKLNKKGPNKKNRIEKTEKIESHSYKMLTQKEIMELKNKNK